MMAILLKQFSPVGLTSGTYKGTYGLQEKLSNFETLFCKLGTSLASTLLVFCQ